MEIKLLEIRDRGTTIPALAIRLLGRDDVERWLLERGGFYGEPSKENAAEPYVVLMRLTDQEAHYDPYEWSRASTRTMPLAHRWLLEHWREVASGDVVDVEFLQGERPQPKMSDRFASRVR